MYACIIGALTGSPASRNALRNFVNNIGPCRSQSGVTPTGLNALFNTHHPPQCGPIGHRGWRTGDECNKRLHFSGVMNRFNKKSAARVCPKSALNNTLQEIKKLSRDGDRDAKTAWKLLNDLCFEK